MSLLAGAVIFRPPGRSQALARNLATRAAATGALRMTLLHDSDWLTLYQLTRPVEGAHPALLPHAEGKPAWLVGDVSYATAQSMRSVHAAPPSTPQAALDVPGRWHYVEADTEAQRLRIASDMLGTMFLYMGRRPDGFVFANDFAAVAACLAATPSIDLDTCVLELAMGSVPDDRTVFREISLAPAGACIEFSADGMRTVWRLAMEYGDRHQGLPDTRKFELMDEIYASAVERQLRPFGERLYVSFSAGYDSRYALAFGRRGGIKMGLATFGHPRSTEVLDAQRVCARIATSSEVYPAAEADWRQWRSMVRMLGGTRVMQWSGWALSWGEFLAQRARNVVHGLMGDAASGRRVQFYNGTDDWLRSWLAKFAVWDLAAPEHAPRVVRREAARRLAEVAF